MNIVDITDSAFSLANITPSSDIIKEIIPDVITEFIPKILTDSVPNIIPETLPDFISDNVPDISIIDQGLHDENTIYIFLSIVSILFLIGVFIYNYLNKYKRVRFEENQENNKYYNDYTSNMSDF